MHKKNLYFLFIILLITGISAKTQANNQAFFNALQKFYNHNYFIFNNIKIFGLCLIGQIGRQIYLQHPSSFKDAPNEQKEEVINTAREIGFSENEVKKLSIKIPKKNSFADWNNKNNNAACIFSTIILGRKNIKELKDAWKDKNVRKFIYAHELSHVKYNHHLKIIFYNIIASAIIAEVSVKIACYSLDKFSETFKNQRLILNLIKSFLCKNSTKLTIQAVLVSVISKIFEKNADLGAAALGKDVITGGIKHFKAMQNIKDTATQTIINKFDGNLTKIIVSFILQAKELLFLLTSSHPSYKERIRYLKALLPKEA